MLTENGHTAEIEPGQTSQYDVLAGDELVFSKQREGRWPDDAEILAALSR